MALTPFVMAAAAAIHDNDPQLRWCGTQSRGRTSRFNRSRSLKLVVGSRLRGNDGGGCAATPGRQSNRLSKK